MPDLIRRLSYGDRQSDKKILAPIARLLGITLEELVG